MYYDLIASLPHLPHFELVQHLPITQLRLRQRLGRLRPAHADQLQRALPLVRWRPEGVLGRTDAETAAEFGKLMHSELETPLREYVAFRMDQRTLVAALRRKQDGLGLPEGTNSWGVGPRVQHIRRHWDAPDFLLAHVYPWLPQAWELLTAADARGLERLLMNVAWQWLTRCAERDMFGFEAVISFVFKWDMLQAWLACDADQARIRFTELIDQVTYVEHNEY
jgi:hypothetical protein